MNLEDFVKNSNSWHWLACVVAASAVASCLMPRFGWRDVLQYRNRVLAEREKSASKRLEEMKSLCAVDVEGLNDQCRATSAETERFRAQFAKYGMEALPVGDKAVFAAQSRVGEALSRRKLRVISTEAKVAERPVAAPAPKPVQKPKKTLSPSEIIASAERAASKLKDKKMAQKLVEDARRQAAKAASSNAQSEVREVRAVAVPKKERVPPPFRTETLEYRVAGDFCNMFMFFVAETHKKPNYNFRDIVVSSGEDGGMELSFVLQVNHK